MLSIHRGKLVRYLGLVVAANCFALAGQAQDLGHGYTRQGDVIVFEGKRIDQEGSQDIDEFVRAVGHELILCGKVDAGSFEVLNEEYTKDKNKVYYKWISPGRFWVVELPDADVKSFQKVNFAHATDKNAIWYADRPIPDSDPTTIQLIANRIVKDSKRVYFSGQPKPQFDAATFHRIGSGYYADSNGVYWGDREVVGADKATFKVIGDSFIAADRNKVYRSGQHLPNIDAGSCKLIWHDPYGYQVISDKNGVYLNQHRFLHANPENFKMTSNRLGIGGDYVFWVDVYHGTPVTIYREEDQLVAEMVLYEQTTTSALAIIKANVTNTGLENIRLSPAPGESQVSAVPQWQIQKFQRPNLVRQLNEAGKFLAGDVADSAKR